MHQKIMMGFGTKFYDKGFWSRGRSFPELQPDGTYELSLVFINHPF